MLWRSGGFQDVDRYSNLDFTLIAISEAAQPGGGSQQSPGYNPCEGQR